MSNTQQNASYLVENWLKNQGFRSARDEHGILRFRYQGLDMVCPGDDDDPLFLRIVMPGIYSVKGDRAKVLEAISTICSKLKAIKAFLDDDGDLWLAIEMFVDSTPDIDDFVERCLDILVAGHRECAGEILG